MLDHDHFYSRHCALSILQIYLDAKHHSERRFQLKCEVGAGILTYRKDMAFFKKGQGLIFRLNDLKG